MNVVTAERTTMTFRSNPDRGRTSIPVNAALVGYRINSGMPVKDALEAYDFAEALNEFAASARRHPSWNPAREEDPRYAPDPEWTTEEIRAARTILIRASRAFAPDPTGRTHLRDDGRFEVADHADAADLYCEEDDWCILEAAHPGDCNSERDLWFGPDTLYRAPGELVGA